MLSSLLIIIHSIFTACPSGQVSAPADGSVTFTASNYFESVATFTCDDGYDLIGECQLVCLSDGNWSGSKPSCTLTSK